MHRDFSRAGGGLPLGARRRAARERARTSTTSSPQGYWVFTRHDAVATSTRRRRSSPASRSRRGSPNPIYRFVPTQIDAPDHIKYRRILNPWFSPRAMEAAEPMMRELCRRLVEDVVAEGRCDFVDGVRAALPDRGVPERDRRRPCPTPSSSSQWVEDFFSGFGGDPAGAGGDGARRSARCASTGSSARRAPRASRSRARATSPRTCSTRPSTTSRWTDAEMLDMLHRARRSPASTPRAPSSGTCSATSPTHPEHRQTLIDDPELDPARGRGGAALLHDHLRRRAQGHARHRVPRRAAQAGRHGLRARVRAPTAIRAH